MNQQLRIAIIGLNYTPEPTGNAPYTARLAEALVSAGHTVRVITGYPHYPEWRINSEYKGWKRHEVINGVEVRRLRHFVPKKPQTLPRMHMELSFGVRAVLANWNNPDVIVVVSPALFSSALAITRGRLSRRRPAIAAWVQDIYSRGVVETQTGSKLAATGMARVESLILRATDGVVAIHERFQDYLVTKLGVERARTRVIRNWTHLPESPTAGLEEMREKLGWSRHDIVVLHAGNMGKKQGLENVVQAARLAQDHRSSVRFVLMGDGNQRKFLESISLDIRNLDFVDPLPGDDFQVALAAADILLVNELPGVRDMAVPSKLTSYFNAGVPVIAATDEGSVTAAEITTSGGGIRVDAAAPESLLNAAEELGSRPELARALGKSGLQFRQETLSEASAIAQYDEFIMSLASSRGR
ncbi:glycosyltransferase family 4 protein [Arthrobacter sp. OAP107]|uniref:glycosyltransferase family 4 protein n=1 Tax=Arthrobacter sp. OAP107 TaxID=3156445 RepID=UPI00339ACA62